MSAGVPPPPPQAPALLATVCGHRPSFSCLGVTLAVLVTIDYNDDDYDDDDDSRFALSCPWLSCLLLWQKLQPIIASILTLAMTKTVAFFLLATMMMTMMMTTPPPLGSPLPFLRMWHCQSLVEAAVEISPVGVQLVSVYGKVIADNDGNRCLVHHAFLSLSCIIEVVVLEIMWPHRIWSQVVFHVLNSPDIDQDDNFNGEPLSDCHLMSGGGADHSPPAALRDLLHRGPVSIVPVFQPDECRGMLTYEECQHVQAKVEGLLRSE
jgi:hypothetical protein